MHRIEIKLRYSLLLLFAVMLIFCSFPVPKAEPVAAADTSDGQAVSVLKKAPALVADSNLNVVNKPVEVTFTDDAAWRETISSVSIDELTLDSDKYSIGIGKISIDKSLFRTSGDYAIKVRADGYTDTGITQRIGLLCLTGDGVRQETVFTRAELEAMPQERTVFSATNDFPMDFSVAAEGVPLQVLLNYAGIKPDAKVISFKGTDGYWADFTTDELLHQKRYIFPDRTEVSPLIALQRMERSADFADMDTADTPVLCLGQRAATEQTVLTFVKLLQTITVTTKLPERWEPPTAKIIDPVTGHKAEMQGGEVSKGTQVVLTGDPKTKIYFTTDGSEPDLDSRIYNLHGCGPMAGEDEPIVIGADTIIKAKAVWPGKLNSETVIFTFRVSENQVNTALLEAPIGESDPNKESASDDSLIFTDIQNNWAREDIEILARKGLIAGRNNNCYEPESKITRAEFIVLLVRALGLQEKVSAEGTFADVDSKDWYAGSIGAAAGQNIICGYNGQFFRPGQSITREEMAAMIIRAARIAGKEDSLTDDEQEQQLAQFKDRQKISRWAEREAAMTVKAGIIKGTAEGEFAPQTDVDRAQSAAIIKRFLTYANLDN